MVGQASPQCVNGVRREAKLTLAAGIDPAAVGAAVTTENCAVIGSTRAVAGGRTTTNLCGRCEWAASFRTVFLAPAHEEADVRARIENALR